MTLWTIARQVPLSMGFSRQEYWNGLPFPPPNLENLNLLQNSLQFSHSVMCDSTAACLASLSYITSRSLLKLMSIELVMLSNHFIFCHPLVLWLSIFPSIRVFSNESTLHIRWPKYWSFNIIPFGEYSGLVSFRMDSIQIIDLRFDLLAVQETLKSLLQPCS